jgi:hypothetical protein
VASWSFWRSCCWAVGSSGPSSEAASLRSPSSSIARQQQAVLARQNRGPFRCEAGWSSPHADRYACLGLRRAPRGVTIATVGDARGSDCRTGLYVQGAVVSPEGLEPDEAEYAAAARYVAWLHPEGERVLWSFAKDHRVT